MDRLTVDTALLCCDTSRCSNKQGEALCEGVYCDQRRVYERLRGYERTGLEPEEIPTGLELANVYAAMLLLKQYQSIGAVEEFRALEDAEQNRREGCEFCRIELRHFPYVVAHSDYASSKTIYEPSFCPMCGNDLRGVSQDGN